MKRSPPLLKLSREHHVALGIALHIDRAADPAARAVLLEAFPRRFRDELDPHFREEEDDLLPRLAAAGLDELVGRTLDEHRRMRLLAGRVEAGDWPALQELGDLLRAHVRFEERELFEVAERVLAAAGPENPAGG